MLLKRQPKCKVEIQRTPSKDAILWDDIVPSTIGDEDMNIIGGILMYGVGQVWISSPRIKMSHRNFCLSQEDLYV